MVVKLFDTSFFRYHTPIPRCDSNESNQVYGAALRSCMSFWIKQRRAKQSFPPAVSRDTPTVVKCGTTSSDASILLSRHSSHQTRTPACTSSVRQLGPGGSTPWRGPAGGRECKIRSGRIRCGGTLPMMPKPAMQIDGRRARWTRGAAMRRWSLAPRRTDDFDVPLKAGGGALSNSDGGRGCSSVLWSRYPCPRLVVMVVIFSRRSVCLLSAMVPFSFGFRRPEDRDCLARRDAFCS